MPLTAAGKKTLASMVAKYGAKKGKEVFYASMNKGTIQRSKMEGSKKGHARS